MLSLGLKGIDVGYDFWVTSILHSNVTEYHLTTALDDEQYSARTHAKKQLKK